MWIFQTRVEAYVPVHSEGNSCSPTEENSYSLHLSVNQLYELNKTRHTGTWFLLLDSNKLFTTSAI
jgi:hypothetical protein